MIDQRLRGLTSSLTQPMKFNTYQDNKKEDPKLENPIKPIDWRDKYPEKKGGGLIDLEKTTDDSTLNRMIQLKDFDQTKQIQGKPGSLYFDKTNKKVKIFISEADGWADIDYTL